MSRSRLLAGLVFLTFTGQAGAQQVIYLPPGSTPQGDYLRGLGFAAIGLGALEVDNAVAGSINTETAIRWNDYVSAVTERAALRYRQILQQRKEERNKLIQEIQKRIREHPEGLDVLKGDALNSLKEQLLSPEISDSSFRNAAVPLPVDVVRQIPFMLGRESLTFSMQRITAKGKAQWPPALQGDVFAPERQAYEHVLDTVLEQQIEGKMEIPDIERVGKAIEELRNKLDQVLTPTPDKLYIDAKRRIDDFKHSYNFMIKSHQAQLVIGDLDGYSGTTVHDLLLFMQKHRLDFGAADTKEERELYRKLHERLREQQEALKLPPDKPASEPRKR
jgi:hypothetical protein